MTRITVRVKFPEVRMTESNLYKAVKGIRMNETEVGVKPAGEFANVEFYSRNKDKAWDAYHDFRKAYTESIIQCDVSTGKKSVTLFNRA